MRKKIPAPRNESVSQVIFNGDVDAWEWFGIQVDTGG